MREEALSGAYRGIFEVGKRLGLIGLGNIRVHFATRLLAAGHALVVYDRNPDATARLLARGATAAESARALADETDIVLLCLPLPAVVAEVAAEVAGGEAARIVVDLSTTGPSVTK